MLLQMFMSMSTTVCMSTVCVHLPTFTCTFLYTCPYQASTEVCHDRLLADVGHKTPPDWCNVDKGCHRAARAALKQLGLEDCHIS